MKESPTRCINPFLSDEENDNVNFTSNLDNVKFEKSLEHSNDPSESVEKAKEVYIDKNVTECQLPEITCFEETGFNAVKDICVDEGLSHGEIIKCDKEHHELSCNSETVNGDKHDHNIIDDMIKEDLDTQLISTPLEDKMKLFGEPNNVSSSELSGPDNLMQNGEEKLDSGSISLNNSIKVLEPGVNDVDQKLSEDQSTGSEANEQSQTNHTTYTPNEIMVESTSLNSDNMKPTGPHEPHLNVQSTHDDISSSNITLAARGGGESSFSMAGPVSGHITYLDPVTASGSLSHRSDGSNTSIRSFAFPILQNEWNSSPVRMEKADPKQSRKHQGWRQALMCCRF